MRVYLKLGLLTALALAACLTWGKTDACQTLLGAGIRVTADAEADRVHYDISDSRFREIAETAQTYLQKFKNPGRDPFIIYRKRWESDSRLDVGYKVQLEIDGRGALVLNLVEPVSNDDERAYFLKLASQEDLNWIQINFPHVVFGRRSIQISPYTQIKLREKHFLTIEEVRQAFMNRTTSLIEDRQRGRNRFSFVGKTASGKRLRVALGPGSEGVAFNLVSAYQERQ